MYWSSTVSWLFFENNKLKCSYWLTCWAACWRVDSICCLLYKHWITHCSNLMKQPLLIHICYVLKRKTFPKSKVSSLFITCFLLESVKQKACDINSIVTKTRHLVDLLMFSQHTCCFACEVNHLCWKYIDTIIPTIALLHLNTSQIFFTKAFLSYTSNSQKLVFVATCMWLFTVKS